MIDAYDLLIHAARAGNAVVAVPRTMDGEPYVAVVWARVRGLDRLDDFERARFYAQVMHGAHEGCEEGERCP